MTIKQASLTIAINETVSSSIELNEDRAFVGFYVPASFTGTAISFQASSDNSTFVTLLNEGSAYSLTVAASRYVSVDPAVFVGCRYIKLVSGTSEAAARTLTVCLRGVA